MKLPPPPDKGVGLGEAAFLRDQSYLHVWETFLSFINTKPFHCEFHTELSVNKC